MTKDEMTTLLRSVGCDENTVTGMSNAFDLGVDWERTRVLNLLKAWGADDLTVNLRGISNDVQNGVQYP